MATYDNPADEAADKLAQRLANRLHLAHTTQVCSGLLTHDAVVRVLASDTATTVGTVHAPQAAPAAETYMVTVRNVDRGEEYTHPHVLRTLLNWHIHFVDQPIMRRIDLHATRNAIFPPLKAPADRATWTVTKLFRDGELYHVIVTVTPFPPLPVPSPHQDTVLVYLASPILPRDHLSYTTAAKTSAQRRAVAVHMALIEIAKARGFVEQAPPGAAAPAPDQSPEQLAALAQAAMLHGDPLLAGTAYASTTLAGAFESNSRETSAGATVLPLVLRHLHFLLPGLHPDRHALQYDLLQPHRCAYLFQIRSLGGWGVFGAVNMHASLEAIRAQYQTRELLDDVPAGSLVPVSITTPATAIAIHAMTIHLLQARNATTANFDAAVAAMPPALGAPFLGADGHPSIDAPTNDQQTNTLPSPAWCALTAYVGTRVLYEPLRNSLVAATSLSDIQLGDRCIDAWLEPKTATAPTPVELVLVLFKVLEGFAEVVLQELPPAARPHRMYRQLHASIMNQAPPHVTDYLTLSEPDFAAFLRACRGIPPMHWYSRERTSLFSTVTPLDLCLVLAHRPWHYRELLTPLLRKVFPDAPDPAASLVATAAAAPFYNQNLMNAYRAAYYGTMPNNRVRKHRVTLLNLSSAVAYVLLTHDHDGFAMNWI